MSTEGTTINTRVTGAARDKCWQARDVYFVCLDQYDDDENKCAKSKEQFEASCSATWVCFLAAEKFLDFFFSFFATPLGSSPLAPCAQPLGNRGKL
jgi:hypothetical protein